MFAHQSLNVACTNLLDRADRHVALLVLRTLVVVVHAAPAFGTGSDHCAVAVAASDKPAQCRLGCALLSHVHSGGVRLQHGLCELPGLVVDDCLLLAGVHMPLIEHLPDVGVVIQDIIDRLPTPLLAHDGFDSILIEFIGNLLRRLDFEVAVEDSPDYGSLFRIHIEPFLEGHIPEGDIAADPLALLARCGHFVLDARGDHLTLELSECHEDVQHHASCGRLRIDFLRYGNEGHVPFLERAAEVGEVAE